MDRKFIPSASINTCWQVLWRVLSRGQWPTRSSNFQGAGSPGGETDHQKNNCMSHIKNATTSEWGMQKRCTYQDRLPGATEVYANKGQSRQAGKSLRKGLVMRRPWHVQTPLQCGAIWGVMNACHSAQSERFRAGTPGGTGASGLPGLVMAGSWDEARKALGFRQVRARGENRVWHPHGSRLGSLRLSSLLGFAVRCFFILYKAITLKNDEWEEGTPLPWRTYFKREKGFVLYVSFSWLSFCLVCAVVIPSISCTFGSLPALAGAKLELCWGNRPASAGLKARLELSVVLSAQVPGQLFFWSLLTLAASHLSC